MGVPAVKFEAADEREEDTVRTFLQKTNGVYVIFSEIISTIQTTVT